MWDNLNASFIPSPRGGAAVSTSKHLFTIRTTWDRPVVPTEGGPAVLLTHIVTGMPPDLERDRPPMDVAFVIDRSGSMSGEPLALVKEAVIEALRILTERDRIALVSFDDRVRVWHGLAPLTETQRQLTAHLVRGITPGGSTNLNSGWLQGCQQLMHEFRPGERRVRRVILLTDGRANAGETHPQRLTGYATQWREQGIATTTIGVADHFDEDLLATLAEHGGGNFHFARHPRDFEGIFTRETSELSRVVAIAPNLQLTLGEGMTAELLNTFPYEVRGADLRVDLRDLLAGDDLMLVMEIHVPAGPPDTVVAVTGSLRLADGTIIPIAIPALQRMPLHMVHATPADPEVLRNHAIERANRTRRDAMRLDREGDVVRSRAMLRQARQALASAPQSAETVALSQDIAFLSEQAAPFDDATRKTSIRDAHERSRGRHRS
jgi:Ca-activated chloride channel family protein